MRRLTEDDFPWLHELFPRRYPGYSARGAETWMRAKFRGSLEACLAQRTDDAFCVTLLHGYHWLPFQYEAHVIALCAEEGRVWQAIALLRCSVIWGYEQGATAWRIHADTGSDIGPLMRRLRVPEDKPRYKLDLRRKR